MTVQEQTWETSPSAEDPDVTTMAPGVEDQDVTTKSPIRRKAAGFVLLLIALPILGAALGLAVAALTPTSYTAHAYVILITTSGGADSSATNAAQATARVATKTSVLDAAGAGASLIQAAEDGRLAATASPDAPLVDLSARAGTAEEAENLADELARSTEIQVNNFSDATSVSARVFASASKPLEPTLPNYPVTILAGAALGLLASAAVFILTRSRESHPNRDGASAGTTNPS